MPKNSNNTSLELDALRTLAALNKTVFGHIRKCLACKYGMKCEKAEGLTKKRDEHIARTKKAAK